MAIQIIKITRQNASYKLWHFTDQRCALWQSQTSSDWKHLKYGVIHVNKNWNWNLIKISV